MLDYTAIWRHAESLPWIALFTTGRVGSHLLHSFMDSHPSLFVGSGVMLYHDFWRASKVVASGTIVMEDLADELIGHFLERLKTRYDNVQRTDRLGENQDQSIDLDTREFRAHLLGLLAGQVPRRGPVLRAFLVAYSLCLGQDPYQRTAFFDHPHHLWNLQEYLEDFPDCKLLGTTRDPRASWVSAVEHWASHRTVEAHPLLVWFHFVRQSEDYQLFATVPNPYRVIRLEDMGKREVLEDLCTWMGIPWDDCLLESTWGGLRWWGDRVTRQRPEAAERGFSPRVTRNDWTERLSESDKRMVEYLWEPRLRVYGYPYKHRNRLLGALPTAFRILRPMALERRYGFGVFGADRSAKGWVRPFYYYGLRVGHCYRLLWDRLRGRPFPVRF